MQHAGFVSAVGDDQDKGDPELFHPVLVSRLQQEGILNFAFIDGFPLCPPWLSKMKE